MCYKQVEYLYDKSDSNKDMFDFLTIVWSNSFFNQHEIPNV